MKQEFTTVWGKAYIEREVLFLRSIYHPFEETAFARIGLHLLLIFLFVFQFFREEGPSRNVGIVIWGFLTVMRLPEMYTHFFRTSYASRIPMRNIESFTTEEDIYKIQTTLTLRLRNGRYKKMIFRNLENQLQPFIDAISPYLAQPQTA